MATDIKAAELRRLRSHHQLAIEAAAEIAGLKGRNSPEFAKAEKAIEALWLRICEMLETG